MIIVSPILDSYFKFRLKGVAYRKEIFQKAIEKKLRFSKAGVIILRNLGELMTSNPAYHKEFEEICGKENYQKVFWESDLGYLWYQGNLNAQNKYFQFAIEEIKKNNLKSVLDVGCGWGRFCKDVMDAGVKNCKGIDISADIIQQAKSHFPDAGLVFEHKDVLEENGKFDLITLFGSTDYIPPATYQKVLEHILEHANKEIIIVNSLRGIPLEKAKVMEEAIEVKRYDDGYLQATNYLLKNLNGKFSFDHTINKFGADSIMVVITKK